MNEFDITGVTSRRLHSQVLSDLLANFFTEYEPLDENLLYKEICFVESKNGVLALMVRRLTEDGTNIYLAFKLEFLCSNNEAEYEALFTGLILSYKWEFVAPGARILQAHHQTSQMRACHKGDCSRALSNCYLEVDKIFFPYSVRACHSRA